LVGEAEIQAELLSLLDREGETPEFRNSVF
jgi:hypothetical protein